MTEATTIRPSNLPRSTPKIHFQVAMPQPSSHLFEVSLQISGWSGSVLDLKLPVWTPGSYLVREYAKNLQDFSVQAGNTILPWRKLAKNHWQVGTNGVYEVTVQYRIFANELSVRTNHLDCSHGYFNPAALCFYIPDFTEQEITITIIPPQADWQVATPLPVVPGIENTFVAADFDTLVDSPFEVGTHQFYQFEALGKFHELAIWGKGNAEPERMIEDIKKIIEVEAGIFGGLPYERYLFLLHLSPSAGGGLEHKYACSLIYPRFNFRKQEKYESFMQLVAHEFFHLWNVKRLRPKGLEKFDYDRENYTPSLWFSEGTTSYYDLQIPMRAGIYDAQTFLQNLSKEVTLLQTKPGRKVQPLSESSFDAWIKLYRRDANSDNCQISYYLKGELVSFLLDLLIRERQGNERSLDDVMRYMWENFGKGEIGFTGEQLQEAIELVAGKDLSDFFASYIDGIEELPFDEYLAPFGLRLQADIDANQPPYIGLKAKFQNGKQKIEFVEFGSPAQLAGVSTDDELLAIDGMRVNADQLNERLKDYQPGDTIHLSIFHQDELQTLPITLTEPQPNNYKIVAVENPDRTQQQNFQAWLGIPLENLTN
ncbi:M61 family metallopeptidase [Aerosakkonemataceae cyanobacterium BLCC-F154]|uniref:M61 family metallopeptidase n=1 Tax=Floridaenema fluviatile BLCC-F154 TaxID=3153640 RepID=A0ABV4YE75_9CYAN